MIRLLTEASLFAAYMVCSAGGLLLVKYFLAPARAYWSTNHSFDTAGLWVAAGGAMYIASFLIWLLILSRNQLTVAYPLAIGLTLIASALGAAFFLQEHVSWMRALGIFAILAGAGLIVRS